MSSIPPNIVGPILQSGIQQKQAARQLESEREQQDALGAKAARRSEQAADTIGEDASLEVSADSEGGGSQGRAFQDADQSAEDAPSETPPADGVRREDDGQPHLDIEA